MKTRNSFYNSLAGLLYYFITILLGIVNRKAVIAFLGIEYQGINSLFGNILSMLSIAELGIGTAIIYHLYCPLSEGNLQAVKSLMNFYRKCYYAIAMAVLIFGLLVIPFLNMFIQGYTLLYPLWFLYIWFLADVVLSYLFTFKRSILIADQKNYLVLLCDLLYQFFSKIGQIVVLFCTRDFICYLAVMVISRLAENFLINGLANRKYPFLKGNDSISLEKEILDDIKQKVKGAAFHKIGGFIVLGTDNILISKFFGLMTVGIYSNYSLIINSIKNICNQIMSATTASVGHMLAEHNEEKSRSIFKEMQILNVFIHHCDGVGIYCVATPLVSLLFGKEYIVSEFTLFVLACNFFIQGMRCVFGIFKDAAGILYEDRFIPLIESAVNIAASIILLKRYGLAGIFMGTILSSMILFGYTYPFLVVKRVLKGNVKVYFCEQIWLVVLNLGSLVSAKWMCGLAVMESLMLQILWNCVISVVVAFLIYFLGYAIWKKETKLLLYKLKSLLCDLLNI